MSYSVGSGYYQVEASYAELVREAGLTDAMSVFDNPHIVAWRSIRERENCVLDLDDGRRLHIKRNKRGFRGVDQEVQGIRLLEKAGIRTVPVVGYGRLHDGRGFLITENLDGFADCERLLEAGISFQKLLNPLAQTAGKLHAARLHHRDLYIGHFWANLTTDPVQVRLIDAARVRPLPRLFKTRWLVKDVAQFFFSLQRFKILSTLIDQWWSVYTSHCAYSVDERFKNRVNQKIQWIQRHNEKLRRKDPDRNLPIDR
jgi:hypothetical protein